MPDQDDPLSPETPHVSGTSPRDPRKSWVFTDPIEGYLRTERLSGVAVLPILPQEGTSFRAARLKSESCVQRPDLVKRCVRYDPLRARRCRD